MKIIFFARRFYPLIGGVEKHCLLLGKELLKRGHQLTIITEWDYDEIKREYVDEPPKYIAEEEYEGIKIIRIPITVKEKLKKWQIWRWFVRHHKLIQVADLIHCHDVFYWFLPFRIFCPKKKVFVTFHGYEGNQPPNWRKRLSHQIADRLSQGNICIGDFQAKWYGVKPTYVSYGAVGIGGGKIETKRREVGREVGSGERRYIKQDNDHIYDLCYVGRLAEDVGITVYLQALKILKKRGLSLSLAVCGDGPLMAISQEYVKNEELKVDFLGFTNEALSILESSRIALISRYLGIIEAMIQLKPIVAVYDNDIKKDYLALAPFAKWIRLASKPNEVADVIVNYLNQLHNIDKDNNRLLEDLNNARDWAKDQTWGKMADLYLKLWQQESV